MKVRNTIIISLVVVFLTIMKVSAQSNHVMVWSLLSEKPILVLKVPAQEGSILSKVDSLQLKEGMYVVYFGEINLDTFHFPDNETNSMYSLYEDPLIRVKMVGDSCYKEADPLPNGKWLKIKIREAGIIEVLKEKNVKDGYLHGKVEYNREHDIEAADSKTLLTYKNGYMITHEIFDKKGKVWLRGKYGDCNKIIEERIWSNGNLWKVFKDCKVTEYDEKGKILRVLKTDAWGHY